MTGRSGNLAVVLVAVLAACGGGSGTTQPPGATTGTGGDPTQAPVATTIDGSIADPCSLLTVDEATEALGTDPITPLVATPSTGDPASCSYGYGDFGEALNMTVITNGATAQFQTFVDAGSGEAVAGVGDQALYERGTGRLVFLAGGTFVILHSRWVGGDDGLAALTAIGRVVTARLAGSAIPPNVIGTVPPVVTAQTACELISADEAAGVMGLGPVSADGNPATPQFCTFSVTSTSEVVLTVFLQRQGGAATFDVATGSSPTEPISGLGDRAAFEPSTNILFVVQGDALVNLNIVKFDMDPATLLDQSRQLATIALGHL